MLPTQSISSAYGEDVVLYFVSRFNQHDSITSIRVKVSSLGAEGLTEALGTEALFTNSRYPFSDDSKREQFFSLSNSKIQFSSSTLRMKNLLNPT